MTTLFFDGKMSDLRRRYPSCEVKPHPFDCVYKDYKKWFSITLVMGSDNGSNEKFNLVFSKYEFEALKKQVEEVSREMGWE